jgi:hypothetical protein
MGTSSKQIAFLDGMKLPFTEGFVHLQHVQYNAAKFDGFSSYQTYHWDNVGFDGPMLPVPAQYSVPDALTPGSQPGAVNLGYAVTSGGLQNGPLTFSNVDLAGATGAMLTFNTWFANGLAVNYRLNGQAWHTWTGSSPGGGSAWKGASVPVNLAELTDGTNTVDFSAPADDTNVIANVDLLVPGTTGTSIGSGGSSPGAPSKLAAVAPATSAPGAMALATSTRTATPTMGSMPMPSSPPPSYPSHPVPSDSGGSLSKPRGEMPGMGRRHARYGQRQMPNSPPPGRRSSAGCNALRPDT